MKKEFGKKSDRFIPITFKSHWTDIRTIQKTNGVKYTDAEAKTETFGPLGRLVA